LAAGRTKTFIYFTTNSLPCCHKFTQIAFFYEKTVPIPISGGVNLLFLCLLTFTLQQLPAQTAFIAEYQATQIGLTTAQMTRYQLLQNDPRNLSTRLVATADVRSKQVDGVLSFLLPGLADSLHVEATLIHDDASGFTWSGKILDKELPGYASFLHKNGMISGFIQAGTHFYELMPMGTNYQSLVERRSGTKKGCGSPGNVTSPPGPGPDYCTPGGDAYNPVRLFLTTAVRPSCRLALCQMDSICSG